jgi:DALR anticodon binding domain
VEQRLTLPDHAAVIHYLSPTQWLCDQLATAVYELGYAPVQSWLQLPAMVLDSNHLGRIATPLPLLLVRSLASTVTADAVGHALIEQLNRLPRLSWSAPRYWMHSQGWLYAEFFSESLAQWLQTVLALTPHLEIQDLSSAILPSILSQEISADPDLFELQYAHARCCSLLRLGHQAGLIQLTEDTHFFNLTSPNPIPWLTAQGELRLQTESEQNLLRSLMQFPQSLCSFSAIYGRVHSPAPGCQTFVCWPLDHRIIQRHQRWSQLFQSFYRDCRVLGAVQTKTSELAQARLASLLLLKNVLGFWLNSVMQIDAPTQL